MPFLAEESNGLQAFHFPKDSLHDAYDARRDEITKLHKYNTGYKHLLALSISLTSSGFCRAVKTSDVLHVDALVESLGEAALDEVKKHGQTRVYPFTSMQVVLTQTINTTFLGFQFNE